MATEARSRAIDEEAEIDEFWCVFDVEWPRNHPGLEEAVWQARANSIKLAVSNPCFELWLILHFQDHAAWLDNNQARRLRRQLDGSGDKGLEAAKYMPFTADAARRAAGLDGATCATAQPSRRTIPPPACTAFLRQLSHRAREAGNRRPPTSWRKQPRHLIRGFLTRPSADPLSHQPEHQIGQSEAKYPPN
jgi:hypothetical protein